MHVNHLMLTKDLKLQVKPAQPCEALQVVRHAARPCCLMRVQLMLKVCCCKTAVHLGYQEICTHLALALDGKDVVSGHAHFDILLGQAGHVHDKLVVLVGLADVRRSQKSARIHRQVPAGRQVIFRRLQAAHEAAMPSGAVGLHCAKILSCFTTGILCTVHIL